ncbi:MAG: AAA family ATPase [Acutalibacter sp.]|uniref:AAA family ATPase n=1 Tax=Acutalibacter sp. TaxID=1918636 RepID=UPI00216E86F1|nr:AAA family ATPase [Acutalibacter sp.]MCI9225979.1 AAA family ATPase [Acutalibacter sp.]
MTQKQTELRLIRMSEVELQEVRWLWYPYIPQGKLTIIQGNPGEGKTTLALWIAAICSQGQALPGMELRDPINILYQTVEDGLGDTIKPRLISAGADLSRIQCIDEAEHSLSLLDSRIEQAVKSTNAKLMILDPLQGYLGRDVDMNRANEIRDVLKRLTLIADKTGCSIVLIGHLNKAVGANSAYRGLGSMDFRAAARSVLLVSRMKKDPGVRVIVHDKSSLAPEGKSVAFFIEDGALHWVEGYDKITAEDLLNGGPTNTKVEQTERLVRERLSEGPAPVKEIQNLVRQAGISPRTLDIAKKNMRDVISRKEGGHWKWVLIS